MPYVPYAGSKFLVNENVFCRVVDPTTIEFLHPLRGSYPEISLICTDLFYLLSVTQQPEAEILIKDNIPYMARKMPSNYTPYLMRENGKIVSNKKVVEAIENQQVAGLASIVVLALATAQSSLLDIGMYRRDLGDGKFENEFVYAGDSYLALGALNMNVQGKDLSFDITPEDLDELPNIKHYGGHAWLQSQKFEEAKDGGEGVNIRRFLPSYHQLANNLRVKREKYQAILNFILLPKWYLLELIMVRFSKPENHKNRINDVLNVLVKQQRQMEVAALQLKGFRKFLLETNENYEVKKKHVSNAIAKVKKMILFQFNSNKLKKEYYFEENNKNLKSAIQETEKKLKSENNALKTQQLEFEFIQLQKNLTTEQLKLADLLEKLSEKLEIDLEKIEKDIFAKFKAMTFSPAKLFEYVAQHESLDADTRAIIKAELGPKIKYEIFRADTLSQVLGFYKPCYEDYRLQVIARLQQIEPPGHLRQIASAIGVELEEAAFKKVKRRDKGIEFFYSGANTEEGETNGGLVHQITNNNVMKV